MRKFFAAFYPVSRVFFAPVTQKVFIRATGETERII